MILTTALVGIALSATAGYFAHRWSREATRDLQSQRATETALTFQEKFSELLANLQSLKAARETFGGLSRSEFQRLARPILRRDPEILALEWIPRVAVEHLSQHEQAAQQEGLADYRVWESSLSGQRQPASPR
ncbi:MAG: CHASE domain-containing protein, partial [Acidobacteria bacterium]|nr:CHASE domain-containing protein [Acidobacteriota bacterium]